jgi:hypothetical protein
VRVLDDRVLAFHSREGARAMAGELTWPQVLAPLLAFCAAPRRAVDLVDPVLGPQLAGQRRDHARTRRGWQRDVDVAVRRTLGRLRGR